MVSPPTAGGSLAGKDSFEACEYIIDSVKAATPIWKKEVFEDGEEWVSARPEMMKA